MKLKVCLCPRTHHGTTRRAARHRKIEKKTVGYENVEARETVEFVVEVHLDGFVQREYGIQGIWHTANAAEMIG